MNGHADGPIGERARSSHKVQCDHSLNSQNLLTSYQEGRDKAVPSRTALVIDIARTFVPAAVVIHTLRACESTFAKAKEIRHVAVRETTLGEQQFGASREFRRTSKQSISCTYKTTPTTLVWNGLAL